MVWTAFAVGLAIGWCAAMIVQVLSERRGKMKRGMILVDTYSGREEIPREMLEETQKGFMVILVSGGRLPRGVFYPGQTTWVQKSSVIWDEAK